MRAGFWEGKGGKEGGTGQEEGDQVARREGKKEHRYEGWG
jgi:hypothetical protein